MGKVVTSQGLSDFVTDGKFTNVPDHKPNGAAPDPKPESKPEEKAEAAPETVKVEEPAKPPEDDGLEADDKQLAERAQKRISQKHRQMKEAQEAAAESERFAEQQFNERRLLEQRLTEAETEREALKKVQTPPKEAEKRQKPDENDAKYQKDGQFDWKTFVADTAKYTAEEAVEAERTRTQQERAQAAFEAQKAVVEARIDKARKSHSDYERVIESVKGTEADQVPRHMLNYLWESESGEELRYHLAKNPTEAIRIAKLSPILGIAELGKLEARLSEPVKPVITDEKPVPKGPAAPAPITTLSGEGSTGIVTDPSKMDFKQLRAWHRENERKRH